MPAIQTLFFILFCLTSFPQGYQSPGIAIRKDGDTVIGYVSLPYLRENPTFIFFKTGKSDEWRKYMPTELERFETVDEKYISATIDFDLRPTSLDLSEWPWPKNQTEKSRKTVFLRAVVIGEKISLYEYVDQRKTQYFVTIPGIGLLPLNYKVFSIENHIYVENGFKKQIAEYAATANDLLLRRMIEKAEYDVHDLYMIVERINRNGGSILYKSGKPKQKKIFWYGGMSIGFTAHKSNRLVSGAAKFGSLRGINVGFDWALTDKCFDNNSFLRSEIMSVVVKHLSDKWINNYKQVVSVEDIAIKGYLGLNFRAVKLKSLEFYLGGGMHIPYSLISRRAVIYPGEDNNVITEKGRWSLGHSVNVNLKVLNNIELGLTGFLTQETDFGYKRDIQLFKHYLSINYRF